MVFLNYHKRYRPYEEKFLIFSEFIEKIILRVLILSIAILILSQFLLSFDEIREVLTPIEKIEGQ